MSKFTVLFAIQSLMHDESIKAELNTVAVELSSTSQWISNTVIDSRDTIDGSLFIAFSGAKVDGHDYISVAKDLGASLVLVERYVDVDIAQIKVSSSQLALACLAKAYRHSWNNTKVVALTGSAGKTSTKDMLAYCLSLIAPTQSTKGNLNNELGLPLTLLNTDIETQFLVAEMGAAELGDIRYLMGIATPDVALITNIGDAHIGRFGSVETIANTKTEIFQCLKEGAVAVLNADDAYYELFQERSQHVRSVTYSYTNSVADVYFSSDISSGENKIQISNQLVTANLPFSSKHQKMNFISAVACLSALNVDVNVAESIASYKNVSAHRQIAITLSNGIEIIDDTYNSNPAAMKVAIDYAVSVGKNNRRLIVVFGAMAELGKFSERKHIEVTQYAIAAGVEVFMFCGKESDVAYQYCLKNGIEAFYSENADTVAQQVLACMQTGDVVLIKGSRSLHLDKTVDILLKNEESILGGHSACC